MIEIGTRDFHPLIVARAKIECAECGEEDFVDVTDEKNPKRIANEYFRKSGYKVMMPENRDYIGVVCPGCQKDLS